MKKKIIIIICSVILVLGVAGYGIGSYFTEYALSPESDSDQRNIDEKDQLTLLIMIKKLLKTMPLLKINMDMNFKNKLKKQAKTSRSTIFKGKV